MTARRLAYVVALHLRWRRDGGHALYLFWTLQAERKRRR